MQAGGAGAGADEIRGWPKVNTPFQPPNWMYAGSPIARVKREEIDVGRTGENK